MKSVDLRTIQEPVVRQLNGLVDRGTFRRTQLDRYIKNMSQANDNIIFDDHVAEVLREQGFIIDESRDKARSLYDPEKLYDALALYGPHKSNKILMDADLSKGFNLAFKVFSKPKDLSHLSVLKGEEHLMKAMKLNKSSGLPMMSSKLDSFVYSLDREEQIRLGLKSPNPCVAFKRTQENFKTRLVWGYPMEMTLMEARFARPLIDKFLSSRTTMAFGLKKHELGAFLEYHVNPEQVGGFVYCLDYSKFDSSIHSGLISRAFSILKTWFSDEDLEEYGWEQVIRYFSCTPIVMPDGHLYTGKRHGVPSGSYFTQMIDSIVNTMIIGALASKLGQPLHWRQLYVLGDDSIFNLPNRVSLESISQIIAGYGITVNIQKSSIGTMHFLGAYWVRCLPDESISKLVGRAVFPETFRQYSEEKSKRQQAMELLASYASQYRSAWKFIPSIGMNDLRTTEWNLMNVKHQWMSGSDRYHWEEGLRMSDFRLDSDFSPVFKRMLL